MTISPPNGNTKWLMGILASLVAGISLGWFGIVNSDLRRLVPDVAVLKVQVEILSIQGIETNRRLTDLAKVLDNLRDELRSKK